MNQEQLYTLIVNNQSFELPLTPEEQDCKAEPGRENGWLKMGGRLPWVGEPTEYFPEEIIGLTVKDPGKNEYSIVEAEYELSPCGQRFIRHLWLRPNTTP